MSTMATTFAPPAPRFIPARWHGPRQTPRRIVIHSTVGPTRAGSAEATARYFASTERKASAHYVIDAATEVQCVGDHTLAYHCGYNADSIGLELCDYPHATSRTRWSDDEHKAMLRRAVRLTAQLCLAYNIPPRYVGPLGLLARRSGITTHADMSKAFKRSTHWDPGAWPRRSFMRQVRAEVTRIRKAAK